MKYRKMSHLEGGIVRDVEGTLEIDGELKCLDEGSSAKISLNKWVIYRVGYTLFQCPTELIRQLSIGL